MIWLVYKAINSLISEFIYAQAFLYIKLIFYVYTKSIIPGPDEARADCSGTGLGPLGLEVTKMTLQSSWLGAGAPFAQSPWSWWPVTMFLDQMRVTLQVELLNRLFYNQIHLDLWKKYR